MTRAHFARAWEPSFLFMTRDFIKLKCRMQLLNVVKMDNPRARGSAHYLFRAGDALQSRRRSGGGDKVPFLQLESDHVPRMVQNCLRQSHYVISKGQQVEDPSKSNSFANACQPVNPYCFCSQSLSSNRTIWEPIVVSSIFPL
jgi:hypothetical protein